MERLCQCDYWFLSYFPANILSQTFNQARVIDGSMTATKFYYYNVWIEDKAGNRLNPREVLSDEVFSENLYDIAEKGDKRYTCQFDFIRSYEHYGVLIRTKDDSGYVRLKEDGGIVPLAEATEDEGETGDIDLDYVDFGAKVHGKSLDVLIEVGFQTPEIGMITEYLDQHVNESEIRQGLDKYVDSDDLYSIEYETRLATPVEEKLERLLDSELKKVNISFKKNPKVYDGLDVEQTLKSLVPDDYRLEFGISLHRGKDLETSDVREFMGRFTSWIGHDEETVEQSITKIDFPRIMSSFEIIGIEGDEQVEENLADDVLKEEIDTSRYGIYDSNLGKELCEHLRRIDEK